MTTGKDTSEILMIIETSNYLNRLEANQYSIFTQKFHLSVSKTLKKFDGIVLKKDNNSYLVTFKSISDAVLCALKIQYKFKYVTPKFDASNRRLAIALNVSNPARNGDVYFEKATILTRRMCEVVKDQLVVSSAIKTLYKGDSKEAIIDKEFIRVLSTSEEKFLTKLMDYFEIFWDKPGFNVANLSFELDYSESQLYRKMKRLTGKSSVEFMREFKLHKALNLLHDREGSISEIALKTGFNSATYFTKCFKDKYGILPSKYVQQHTD